MDAAVCCCQGYDIEMGAQEIIRRPLYNWLLCVKIRRLYRQVRVVVVGVGSVCVHACVRACVRVHVCGRGAFCLLIFVLVENTATARPQQLQGRARALVAQFATV